MPFTLLQSPATMMADPLLGGHVLSFYRCGGSGGLSTPPIITQTSGSTMLVWVGRGDLRAFTEASVPKDNKGNTYALLDTVHAYTRWPGSGEALYASPSVAGGEGHVFTAPMPAGLGSDEITMAVVEVKNGGVIQEARWIYAPSFSPTQTSLSVTTTAAATLVAFWAGDSGSFPPGMTAVPDNGFTRIEEILTGACFVQAAVATKEVAVAGTYNVTWTSTPPQGGHVWLVAVQSVPTPAPALTARPSGEHLVISWPASATGYQLEVSSQPSAPAAWTSVTNFPVIIDGQNTVTNEMTSETLFYRLKK